MTQRIASQRFRQRKLSTKQNLAILRENEVEGAVVDDDAQRHVPKVETGVEKGEETEHHLQAIMAAAAGGNIAAMSIPTPETTRTALQYEQLYPPNFSQPATYIRFSSTVEDSIGSPYCMTAEDDVFLTNMNRQKPKQLQCAESQLEELMSFFDEAAQTKQPFAAVDNPPVVPFEEMEAAFDDTVSDAARIFARDVYDHWKALRLQTRNRPLLPALKFETGAETDDADPYVCFRRREVRQVRKTRGRDAQVTEKLKKLRRELEDARFLLHHVRQREYLRRDQLALDREIFDQRAAVKAVKRSLAVKGDDEDLVNQKPSPRPKPQLNGAAAAGHRGMQGSGLKPQLTRADGRPPDVDLVSLQEMKARKEEEITRFIDDSLLRHQNWNRGWVDITWRPITPPLEHAAQASSFRPALTEYLPSPPASVSSDEPHHHPKPSDGSVTTTTTRPSSQQQQQQQPHPVSRPQSSAGEMVLHQRKLGDGGDGDVTVRYASPPSDAFDGTTRPRAPSFRRRMGRGGRLMIDRRGITRPAPAAAADNNRVLDRFKYDVESDEDDDTILTDPFDTMSIRYRVALFATPRDFAQKAAAMRQQAALPEAQAAQGAQASARAA